MEGSPHGFWGKLELGEDKTPLHWHPLVDHCADVAACCRALLERTILRRRLATLAGLSDLSSVQCDRLSVLALFHDVGKFNIGFQNKARSGAPFTAGHVREVLGLFDRDYLETARLGEALDAESWEVWGEGDAAYQLLVAAIAHHGRPQPVGADYQRRWWSPAGDLDPFEGIRALSAAARRWFPEAFSEGMPLPGVASFQHAFSGLVMLADWLGSDTRFFPYSTDLAEDRMAHARRTAADALSKIGLDPGGPRRSIREQQPDFRTWFGFSPRGAQEKILELPTRSPASLTVLEAETGAGKTEAALARFFGLFHAGEVDGLYFALPTRTAATQIYERVVRAIVRAFPDPDTRPPVTLAVPGYLRVDDRDGQRLARFDVLWNDDEQDRFRYRGWAAENSKRYLAGSVVVGTIDQALLGTLAVGHAHLRNTSLLRHLLVVDEVHASDAYMNRILEELLRRHGEAGGHAFLMSATLGAATRVRLSRPGTRQRVPELAESIRMPFPAISHHDSGGAALLEGIATPGNPKSVVVEGWSAIGHPEAVAVRALDAAGSGARVLVLRNTVIDCVATQQAVEAEATARGAEDLLFRCEGVPAPHHSRFSHVDRVRLDHAVESVLGRGRSERGCVVVATQTVQQSLDLDADLLITDLCPMDVLLQRIGRLHRHSERKRPAGFDEARALILTPLERDMGAMIRKGGEARGRHGFGSVYDDLRILEATWREIERCGSWQIPEDNRRLVESATHPQSLRAIVDDLGERWSDHANRMDGISFASAAHAATNLVCWSATFDDPKVVFPERALERKISTRLGEGDRRAVFDPAMPGPFGGAVIELTVPAFFAIEIPADVFPVDVRTEAGMSRFTFGPTKFIYDRLGLRPWRAPNSEDDDADA